MSNGIGGWEILPGLPSYGPLAKSFSDTGMGKHSEGFVVRFHPSFGESWVGNFKRGQSSCERVLPHPDARHVLVVAGGAAYMVEPVQRKVIRTFGSQIKTILEVPELQALVVGDDLWFEAIGRDQLLWRTRRISWDGIRNVERDGTVLRGEAAGLEDDWYAFEVNLFTGEVTGGSYFGPPM